MSSIIGKTGPAYTRLWHHVDATDRNLLQLCRRIAATLMGKHKPIYHPQTDCGDIVVVTNVRNVAPEPEKLFEFDERRPGPKPTKDWNYMIEHFPEDIIRRDVQRMMPRNRIRRLRLSRLKLFAGPEHPYAANIVKRYDDAIVGDLRPLSLDPAVNRKRELMETMALRQIASSEAKSRRFAVANARQPCPPPSAREILPGMTV